MWIKSTATFHKLEYVVFFCFDQAIRLIALIDPRKVFQFHYKQRIFVRVITVAVTYNMSPTTTMMKNNDVPSTTTTTSVSVKTSSVASTSFKYPRLLLSDAESIRVFLRLSDQNTRELISRVNQLAETGIRSSESIRPVKVSFCVDNNWHQSDVTPGFIHDADTFDYVTDEVMWTWSPKPLLRNLLQ